MIAARAVACLLPLCVYSCTDAPRDVPLDSAPAELAEASIKINEVFIASSAKPAGAQSRSWVEILNTGPHSARLYDYQLTVDGVPWDLPDYQLPPDGLFVIRAETTLVPLDAAEYFLANGAETVALVRKGDRTIVDSTTLPNALRDESFGRHPNGTGRFSVYPRAKVSEHAPNPDLGFVSKLTSAADYRPRDSSQNAIVRHDGFFWILGGWSEFHHDDWHSEADVWRSPDGVRWTLVNPTPPYDPYNSFVAWRGRIWTIGPASFSSTDGVQWRPEPLSSRTGNRSVVFNDAIYNIDGARVMTTEDGATWSELTWSAPWGEERGQPLVTVYRDKLWVIGGFSGYGEANEMLHNDVWSSSDGITWQLIAPSATWTPRVWQALHTYDDKIFMINGANWNEWPDEFGNTAEIWFTDNGAEWFELPSEIRWGARHASLSVVDDEGGLFWFAGYGTGGFERLYNDSWVLRASLFFPKPTGDLRDPSTWGKNLDGTGPSPPSFSESYQIFVLRNRPVFTLDSTWTVTGAGSRIIVGDGDAAAPVWLELADEEPRTLYLQANSTTVVHGAAPLLPFRHPDATVIE
jgi:hypothetical protein